MASEKEIVTSVSIVASGTLAAAKFGAGVMIGSLALIGDALHSLIDLGATVVTWFAVRIADRPPDENHQYGHGKVESLAALVQSALLFLVAGGIAVEAVQRLYTPAAPMTVSVIPFVVLGVEMVVNGWRALALRRVAIKTGSQALAGDALHFASDFFGSIPVLIGIALSYAGYGWGDAVAAIAVAVLISVLAVRLARHTIDTLLDTAPSGAAERVTAALRDIDGVVGIDRVRTRQVGPQHFVEAAVSVPRTHTMERIGETKAAIQATVAKLLGEADVTVTTKGVALDEETIQERIHVIAGNRGLAIHHVTIHQLPERLAIAFDLEVDGAMTLASAHEVATALEHAIREKLGPGVEVETHIEPLQAQPLSGSEADSKSIAATLRSLSVDDPLLSDIHNVRLRRGPDGLIVNFHCRADGKAGIAAVHEAVDLLERRLKAAAPDVIRVIGHAEPRRQLLPEQNAVME
ncbi:cation diffusion facilitator family transporter [Blastochloris viridis]|uniref:Cobalt-zinc-cadmium resistance protein n=1 Tax=Blastochloris viridis TaxID=1079 RepID=A0A0H5BCR1_BLAVI|nr:cation diffusion facilitator family transporter [Blastochloris viridis]ALK10093.1 Ferrous-iron efflux pump FieF [Blastochloris viridis]BAR99980.1 cobalt-zinc-cadmium resistance protein [Blastochloris viridis]CUU42757.1 Ferrous-iron efflux pump FieF [Blastochloris viridis]